MNPRYYASPQEVTEVEDFFNKHGIGDGVKGIELNPFSFALPEIPGKQLLLLRLKNGAILNIGSTYDMLHKGYKEHQMVSVFKSIALPPAPPSED